MEDRGRPDYEVDPLTTAARGRRGRKVRMRIAGTGALVAGRDRPPHWAAFASCLLRGRSTTSRRDARGRMEALR